MKKLFVSMFLLGSFAAALAVSAQAPKAAAPDPAVKAAEAPKKAKAPPRKPEEEEEAGVMIDTRSDGDEAAPAGRAADPDAERQDLPGGLPSSYGQCKGVLADGNRSLLVFENADDGTIYFVQVVFGRSGATWKLAGTLPRSAD